MAGRTRPGHGYGQKLVNQRFRGLGGSLAAEHGDVLLTTPQSRLVLRLQIFIHIILKGQVNYNRETYTSMYYLFLSCLLSMAFRCTVLAAFHFNFIKNPVRWV